MCTINRLIQLASHLLFYIFLEFFYALNSTIFTFPFIDFLGLFLFEAGDRL